MDFEHSSDASQVVHAAEVMTGAECFDDLKLHEQLRSPSGVLHDWKMHLDNKVFAACNRSLMTSAHGLYRLVLFVEVGWAEDRLLGLKRVKKKPG